MQMQRGPQNFQGQQGQGQDGPWGGRKPSMGFRRTYALQQLALMQQGQGLAGYLNDDGDDEGRRSRKPVVRKTVDLSANVMKYMQNRIYERDERDRKEMRPTVDYVTEFEPQFRYQDNPSYAFATKYVSSSVNKIRAPIHSCAWTPEAKRLITGSHNGELTLWSGLTFNFETILQAHEAPIRVIRWSKNDLWMVTADDTGIVKYWQTTMNNAKAFRAHKEAIRDLSFSPTDIKFATASDDKSIGIWDFDQCREDVNLQGHHWDVKSVHWHPFKAMLLSGSKDNLVKVWDPRNGKCISTGHGHKNTVSKVQWNQNGNWFLSCSRDQLIKLWDVRMMKEVQTFRGHKKEVTSLAWHPHFERVFASGSFDGSIRYWMTGPDGSTQAEICGAHDAAIWDLAWHPMGHIIASTSNDHSTRFWTRNRPGDDMTDKYNANQLPEEEKAEALASLVEAARMNPGRFGKLPSVLEGYIETAEAKDDFGSSDFIPGLGTAETDLARVKAEQEKQQAKEAERQRQMELVATMRKRGRGDDDDDREDAYKRQRERRRRDDSDDERRRRRRRRRRRLDHLHPRHTRVLFGFGELGFWLYLYHTDIARRSHHHHPQPPPAPAARFDRGAAAAAAVGAGGFDSHGGAGYSASVSHHPPPPPRRTPSSAPPLSHAPTPSPDPRPSQPLRRSSPGRQRARCASQRATGASGLSTASTATTATHCAASASTIGDKTRRIYLD